MMKHRRRSNRSHLANAAKRRRTWPKFAQRPFPPHSQPNGSAANPRFDPSLPQPEDKDAIAALGMQQGEAMETEELAAKPEEDTLQKQETEEPESLQRQTDEELAAKPEEDILQKQETEEPDVQMAPEEEAESLQLQTDEDTSDKPVLPD